MNLLSEAIKLKPWIIEQRHALHQIPEHGNKEFLTSAHICNVLSDLGLRPVQILDTAIIADLKGAIPGPMVALRADMDALPIQECTGIPFASIHSGMMHACGHDIHMAAVLGAAKLLSEYQSQLPGTVRFLFQPDEEINGGAERMIQKGCLQGVHSIFGAHVRPELPLGCIAVREGAFYAASNPFTIRISGKAAHGAEPQNGADVIVAGAQIVSALQTLITRRIDPITPTVFTIGTFHAGVQNNVIADEAILTGILRTYGQENREFLIQSATHLVRSISSAMSVQAEISFQWGYPSVSNDESCTMLVRSTAEMLFGAENILFPAPQTMTSEDFGYYQQNIPGCFYHVGVACKAPLHSSRFLPDENVLPLMAALHAQIAWNANVQFEPKTPN